MEASASDAALVRLGTGTNDHQANAAVQNNGDETTDEENFAYSPTDFGASKTLVIVDNSSVRRV